MNVMIIIIFFWIVIVISLILYLFSIKYKKIENIVVVLLFLAGSLIIVSVITKDPIFSKVGVPPEFEWVVGLFITGLSSWRLYFNPLKKRVIQTEIKVGGIDTKVNDIKEDITMIKEKVINGKIKFKK